MLLANLAKSDTLKSILKLERPAPAGLESSTIAIDQLLDLFVKGAAGSYNPAADYDYLSYLFADLAKHAEGRSYFLSARDYDGVVPLSKLVVFTEHRSLIRRKGVASTIKNVAFEIDKHEVILDEEGVNILPYLLLPVTGNEEYSEEEMLDMLPDLQLLPPDKKRDDDPGIVQTHIETLTLLTTTREGRERLRAAGVYPVVRETHLRVENEEVREVCDRLVQVLMRDEEGEGDVKVLEGKSRTGDGKPFGSGGWASGQVEVGDDSDDERIVEV